MAPNKTATQLYGYTLLAEPTDRDEWTVRGPTCKHAHSDCASIAPSASTCIVSSLLLHLYLEGALGLRLHALWAPRRCPAFSATPWSGPVYHRPRPRHHRTTGLHLHVFQDVWQWQWTVPSLLTQMASYLFCTRASMHTLEYQSILLYTHFYKFTFFPKDKSNSIFSTLHLK